MIKYQNTLSDRTAKELESIALGVISGQHKEQVRVWTNHGWSETIMGKNSTVICMTLPERFLADIQESLIAHGILNTDEDELLTSSRSAMIYVWMPGAYIPKHNDAKYSKAVTIYLNDVWDFNDGGLFLWRNQEDEDWKAIVPHFNLGIVNAFGLEHGTTPVTSDKLRVTAQIFLMKKNLG